MKTKTRNKFVSLLVCALLAAGCLTGLSLAGTLSARADENAGGGLIFDYAGINRTLLTGVTAADVQTAFEAEGARVKADVEAYNTENGTQEPFTVINSPLGNGWPDGQRYFISAHLDLGAYSGWNNWGRTGYTLMVYNPGLKQAFTVLGDFAAVYVNSAGGWADQVIRCGYPTSNVFTVGEAEYQNFTFGYVTGGEWFSGKKMTDAEGEAVAVDITVAEIAGSMIAPLFSDVPGTLDAYSYAEMQAAYTAYFTGKTPSYGKMNSVTNNTNPAAEIFTQDLGEDGTLVYNAAKKEMFAVGSFYAAWKATAAADWGDPTTGEQTTGGTLNQLFTRGVAVMEKDAEDKDKVVFYVASHVDENGDVVSDFDEDAAGLLSPEAEADLPDGVTAADVKTAVGAKYDAASMGKAAGYMEFSDGVLVQTFTKTGAEEAILTTVISAVIDGTDVRAYVLAAGNYKKYNDQTRYNAGLKKYSVTGQEILGAPVSDVFKADGKDYQNFQYGAMNYTDDISRSGVNVDTAAAETVLDLSRFIKIDTANVKIPQNYNVGAADLSAKFKAAYKALVQKGWAAGMPNREGIGAWPAEEGGQEALTNNFIDGKGMVKLGLHSDSSNADSWYNVNAFLAYNPGDGKVYLMCDGVVQNVASYYSSLGAPVGELTEAAVTSQSGKEFKVYIQNFELGYVTIMASTNAGTYTTDRHYDFTLRGEVNLDGSRIPGVVYPGDTTDPDNPGGGNEDDESGKGCKGCSGSAGAAAAVLPVLGLVALCVVKRR